MADARTYTSPEAMDRSARGFTLAMLGLMGLGLVLVTSATGLGDDLAGRPLTGMRSHVMRLGVAVAVFLSASAVSPRRLFQSAPFLLATALALLVATLTAGISVNGSRRWLDLGFLVFQPSELARVAVVVSLGAWVGLAGDGLRTYLRGVAIPLVIIGVPAALVFVQPDFGSSVYLLFMGFLVIWVAGARTQQLFCTFAAALSMASLVGYQRFAHVGKRLTGFTDPAPGTQVWQGLVALGSGGPAGVGLGEGRAAWGYVPEAENDFILTVLGEELGLVGVLVLVLLYGFLLFHGTRLLLGLRSRFALVVGAGLLFQVGVQALLNISVVTALAPPKGLPLPFVSMGGSSLLVLSLSCGLLLGLARSPEEDPVREGRGPLVRQAHGR